MTNERPRTRGECPTGVCPWVGCRHHLAIAKVTHGTGKIQWEKGVTFDKDGNPDLEEMRETCSLRIADSRKVRSHDEVALYVGGDRQRVEQIEASGLVKLLGRKNEIDPDREVIDVARTQVADGKRGPL